MAGEVTLNHDGPNKWLNGVRSRVEDTGDGYVRLPRSDWQGVVNCFEWGEVLFGDAVEALERIALGLEGRRTSGFKADERGPGVLPKTDWQLAQQALVTIGVKRGEDVE